MRGRGSTFGAISIVNAIAGGKGVTASTRLGTESIIALEKKSGDWSFFVNDKPADSGLARETVRLALKMAGKEPADYSGSVHTTSVLPIGIGLKTSSSSSSATAPTRSSPLWGRGRSTCRRSLLAASRLRSPAEPR